MKHFKIEKPDAVIVAPPVIVNSILMKRVGILFQKAPHISLNFKSVLHGSILPSSSLSLSFEKPANEKLHSECCGNISFSPYIPRDTEHFVGWVAGSNATEILPQTFEQSTFKSPQTLRNDSLSGKIAAMKSGKLAGIIPDMVGRLDTELRRMDELNKTLVLSVWLSFQGEADELHNLQDILEWTRACIEESQWFNATADPEENLATIAGRSGI